MRTRSNSLGFVLLGAIATLLPLAIDMGLPTLLAKMQKLEKHTARDFDSLSIDPSIFFRE